MGNYKDFEYEFIERTLALISQYENFLHKVRFEEQYNYTLLINCLLGLIILPKERIISYIPKDSIHDSKFRTELGLKDTTINSRITNLKDLIISMRNSIAHLNLQIISMDESNLIDFISFKNGNDEIAKFASNEILPFLRYYGFWLLSNLRNFKK